MLKFPSSSIGDVSIQVFDNLPSTDRTLWELLDRGSPLPLAVIARQQSAGRGQWGRTWLSEPGGLYLSLGLEFSGDPLHLVPLTVNSIARGLRSLDLPVMIKWPNDLVVGGKKLGGIKIETRGNRSAAVIGIGINHSNPVPEVGINLSSLLDTDRLPRPDKLAGLTISSVLRGYEIYLLEGIKGVINEYTEIFWNLNQKILFDGREGTIVGINTRGELKVRFATATASTEISLPIGTINLGY